MMHGKTILAVMTAVQALQFAVAVFFHEPSNIKIVPYNSEGYTDFGFAMGYQSVNAKLVVGAPKADEQGKLYTCEMEKASYALVIKCSEKIIDRDDYSRKINPNQNFYLGASIAATSDYIFTCAPLWTMDVRTRREIMSDVFGACFVSNDTKTFRYQGTLERYMRPYTRISNLKSFIGGTGWSTLVDEENDLLLVVKTSLDGDFVYTPMSKPLQTSQSMVLMTDAASRSMKTYLLKHWNIGFGITAGKFFSSHKTVYAFSLEQQNMGGVISFLEYDSTQNKLSIMFRSRGVPYAISNKEINSMFGSTLGAADLNMDGKDELLVGAPAQSNEECVECGALHIYLGGDVETIDWNRLRIILGTAEFGRFGTGIAARDIDGDSIPEIVVSAPYEDEGLGALYILSGYEIYHTLVKIQTFRSILVTDLKLTQRIQKEPFKTLGFSLQFVDDADNNGCDELVAGSPGSGSAVLFKCIQTINLTVSSELIGQQLVREQDANFTVKVCVRVELYALPTDIIGNVSVVSSIIGEATYIPNPKFDIDIACKEVCSRETRDRQFCENVIVILNDKEPRDYTFTSKAVLNTDYIIENKVFNTSFVVASPYSRLVNTIEVPRHCSGNDCIPKLSMQLLWSGSDKYVLGSSSNETVTIRVRNDGNASYEACVRVRVSGAPLARVDCPAENEKYKCYLPRPLKRDSEYSIKLMLNMTRPINQDSKLLVVVELFENCNQKNIHNDTIDIPYVLNMTDIYINGISHRRNITDKQFMDSDSILDDQEYVITNNGTVTWRNVYAIISMKKKPFIHSVKVSTMDTGKCEEKSTAEIFTYKCTLDMMANSTQKITVNTIINGSDIKANLYDDKLNTSSQLILFLIPTASIKEANATTVLVFQKELSFGTNKLLIGLVALLLAIILLTILIVVLCRYGFFRRKQKQRLTILRKTIRQNSRRATHTSEPSKDGVDNVEGLQMDVDDDCPFDNIPIPETTKDNASLVEEKP